jgi:tetratricopeptide (TPR) repeat protein
LAANKRKILANAQKYLQKGQLDKALKEYRSLVDVDPRDANSRLKLGDIQLRQGNRDDAVAAYTKVAEQFMQDGFDAKAVAIYKQIAKIDDKRYEIYEPLAELYQRLGLTSEALTALQTAADAYNRDGRKRDALDLLRKMATLDPTNTTSRLKIADLLRQAEMPSDALSEYEAVAEEFERQGAREELLNVYERILELDPQRASALSAVGRALIDQGNAQRAEPFARKLIEADPELPEGHEMLAEIQRADGREDAVEETYRKLAEIYRNRGDDSKAREITQRFLASEDLATAGGDLGGAPTDSLMGAMGAPGEPIGSSSPEDSIDAATFGDDAEPVGTAAASEPSLAPAPMEPIEAPGDEPDLGVDDDVAAELGEPGGEGLSTDPEQIMAEASVYLRYGKADRAIQTLQALLDTEPDHRIALERLGEAQSEAGQSEAAVASWTRAAEVARATDDESGFRALVERIGSLDAAAAEALGGGGEASQPSEPAAVETPAVSEPETLDDVDLEIELGDDDGSLTDDVIDDDGDLEVDVDISDLDADLPAMPGAADATVMQGGFDVSEPGAADATVMQADLDVSESGAADATVMQGGFDVSEPGGADATVMQADLDVSEPDAAADETPLPGAADETVMQAAESPDDDETDPSASSAPASISEDLEEADFYFNQDLLGEAETLYQRVLEAAPNHSLAQLRLGEIEAKRGGDPASSGSEALEQEAAATPDADDTLGDDLADWDELEPADAAPGTDAGEDAATAADEADDEIEVDIDGEPPDPGETAVAEASEGPGETQPELGVAALDDAADDGSLPPEPAETSAESDEIDVSLEEDLGLDDEADLAVADDEAPADEEAVEDEELPTEYEFEDDEIAVDEVASDDVAEDDVAIDEIFEEEVAEQEEPAEEEVEEPDPVADEPLAAEGAEAPDEAASEATFDLAAELSDVFESEGEQGSAASEVGDESFDAIFREFKKGVKEQLSESDFEAHYDLGIAYREMGLLEDAVGEFRIALESSDRKLGCLHMLGLCALDLDRSRDAVAHLEQALALPDVPGDQAAALRYDLGAAFFADGDRARARSEYEAVAAFDPDYQDVQERLGELAQGGSAGVAEESVETFESFDDLIAEAENALGGEAVEDAEPADDASFDLAQELADEVADAVLDGEAVTELIEDEPVDAEPEPEPPAAEETPKRERKKKKGRKKIPFL